MRKFDYTYLLLVPFFLLEFNSYAKLHFRFVTSLPFAAIWLICQLFALRRNYVCECRKFSLAAVLISVSLLVYHGLIAICDGRYDFYYFFVLDICSSFSLVVLIISLANGRWKEFRMISYFAVILIALSALTSLSYDAGTARILASINEKTDIMTLGEAYDLKSDSVLTYGGAYAAMLLSLCYAYKIMFERRLKNLAVWLAFLIVFVLGVHQAAYSTATLSLVTGLMLITLARFIPSAKKFKVYAWWISSFLVVAIINPHILSIFSNLIGTIAEMTDVEEYRMRLSAIAYAFSGDKESYLYTRAELYWRSFETFLSHPLFGEYGGCVLGLNKADSYDIGGHSSFCDTLGIGGLFLMSILFFGVASFMAGLRGLARAIDREMIWYRCYFSCFLIVLIISIINPVFHPEIVTTLFMLIPAVLFDGRGNNMMPR